MNSSFLLVLTGSQDYIELEGNIELQKKRQDETNERKNAVEAYVYNLRNQLADALSQYVTEAEQASISSKLTETEVRRLGSVKQTLFWRKLGD